MRVESAVHRHLQQPGTIFGVPPLYFVFIVVGMLVTVFIVQLIAGDSVAFAIVLFGLPTALFYSILQRRKEPHCETLLTLPNQFFKGKKDRILVAGTPKKAPKPKRARRK